ncbi:ATP-binding cassette domain-containing protein [Canibacter zhuwentaonis]|uniref:ATP-binding cassette domain-containing protein n=1 Tax=Canibacter zhuwentaonis TaxID=2837491 RepID=UPI003D6F2160
MKYGSNTVLSDISFSISPGVILAVLGSNGAGKSTLMKLVSGLAKPSSGSVKIFGANPNQHASRTKLGVVPQQTNLPKDLTPLEVALFVSSQFPSDTQKAKSVRERCLEHLAEWSIDTFASKRIRDLSGGQEHRVSVALAYLGNPPSQQQATQLNPSRNPKHNSPY